MLFRSAQIQPPTHPSVAARWGSDDHQHARAFCSTRSRSDRGHLSRQTRRSGTGEDLPIESLVDAGNHLYQDPSRRPSPSLPLFPFFSLSFGALCLPEATPAPPTLSCHGWRSPNPATLERCRPFPASHRCAVIAGSASLSSPMAPPRLCLLFLRIERCDFVRVDLLRSSTRER